MPMAGDIGSVNNSEGALDKRNEKLDSAGNVNAADISSVAPANNPNNNADDGIRFDHSPVEKQIHQTDSNVVDIDFDTVGLHISMSKSTRDQCDKESNIVNPSCDYISLMSMEPRNRSWAKKNEELIAKYLDIMQENFGVFTIRSLECRESMCAFEVASLLGPLPRRHFIKNVTAQTRLFPLAPLVGKERKGSQGEMFVTFVIFVPVSAIKK